MSITAKIIADSISESGKRITSFVLTYPRFVHAEFMTHRVLSRNASSSRAIPVQKMIDAVDENPAMPLYYGKAQKGMAADGEMSPEDARELHMDILALRDIATLIVDKWKTKAHKQTLNRYLEPWSHITVLCTATQWGNFFNLRAHKDAQPEIRMLAVAMLRTFRDSSPKKVRAGEWHMPFGDMLQTEGRYTTGVKLKVATARAARVSYLTFDGKIDIEKDIELHDRLAASGHWSPFEHCAQALEDATERSGNFTGWRQYRKQFPNENKEVFDIDALLAEWTS